MVYINLTYSGQYGVHPTVDDINALLLTNFAVSILRHPRVGPDMIMPAVHANSRRCGDYDLVE